MLGHLRGGDSQVPGYRPAGRFAFVSHISSRENETNGKSLHIYVIVLHADISTVGLVPEGNARNLAGRILSEQVQ